jgi:hypothetical protein
MMITGAKRNMMVIMTGNNVMMNVIMKMTVIIITNLAAVAALFFLKVSTIFICSIHYPSSVSILRPVSH